jgi:hypothetical protein
VGRRLDVRLLSATQGRATVELLDESSFVLRVDRPGWLTSFLAAAFRREVELEEGDFYPGDLYDVTVLEVTEDGTDVLAVRVSMHLPLNDPRTIFLRWNGEAYRPLDLSALPVGVPHSLDTEAERVQMERE